MDVYDPVISRGHPNERIEMQKILYISFLTESDTEMTEESPVGNNSQIDFNPNIDKCRKLRNNELNVLEDYYMYYG